MPKTPIFFGHVNLPVSDLDRSINFYCDRLGLKRGPAFTDEQGKMTGIFLHFAQDAFLELLVAAKVNPWQGHLCIATEGIHELVADLRSNGIEVSDITLGRSKGWMAFLRDPDGHALELNEYSHPESWIAKYLRSLKDKSGDVA